MDSLRLARAELEVRKCLGENCKETVLKSEFDNHLIIGFVVSAWSVIKSIIHPWRREIESLHNKWFVYTNLHTHFQRVGYSCARQKDILVQGRMYLTANWFCFYSNILGWETKVSQRMSLMSR